jgi:uncharacterized damage-inducible protein DinB
MRPWACSSRRAESSRSDFSASPRHLIFFFNHAIICHIWIFTLFLVLRTALEEEMELKEFFLMQLEQETTLSRKVIERVPEGRNDWKPHQKSMALGHLAALVAAMPGWVAFMIEGDELNFEDPASDKFRTRAVETRAELLQLLTDGAAKAKRALEGTDEKHLHDRWRLLSGNRVLAEGPRYVMISDAVFSHLAHHRGQLTVYLRLNEAAVPALYGPSADEGGM